MIASKCSLGRNVGFVEVEVTGFFDNVRAVFEKHNFLRKEFLTRMKVFPVSYPRWSARKRKTFAQHCIHRIANDWTLLGVVSSALREFFVSYSHVIPLWKECVMNIVLSFGPIIPLISDRGCENRTLRAMAATFSKLYHLNGNLTSGTCSTQSHFPLQPRIRYVLQI